VGLSNSRQASSSIIIPPEGSGTTISLISLKYRNLGERYRTIFLTFQRAPHIRCSSLSAIDLQMRGRASGPSSLSKADIHCEDHPQTAPKKSELAAYVHRLHFPFD
jgi:hypothetical protein